MEERVLLSRFRCVMMRYKRVSIEQIVENCCVVHIDYVLSYAAPICNKYEQYVYNV